VGVDTIRFYEKRGLLPRPARRPSGFRQYSLHDLRCLKFVRQARSLGFSLEEISELLALEAERDSEVVSGVARRKLTIVNQKIEALRDWRRALRRLVRGSAELALKERSVVDFFDGAAIQPGELPPAAGRSLSLRNSA
ncbi:MAG: MerR family transcriptional regulator, partial [Steroidobacteraceae bacterium]